METYITALAVYVGLMAALRIYRGLATRREKAQQLSKGSHQISNETIETILQYSRDHKAKEAFAKQYKDIGLN